MTEIPKLVSAEGWHVLHLFYKVEHGQWSLLDAADKLRARTNFSDLIEEIRNSEGCQILTFSMVGPKSDLGFMPGFSDTAFRIALIPSPKVCSAG